jgi:hypothetical protein
MMVPSGSSKAGREARKQKIAPNEMCGKGSDFWDEDVTQ